MDLLRLLSIIRVYHVASNIADIIDARKAIDWISRAISEVAPVRAVTVTLAIARLGDGEALEGCRAVPYGPGPFIPLEDLSEIVGPLHNLDNDGTADVLWQSLCFEWPRFGKAILVL
jgi:hypothetical protein